MENGADLRDEEQLRGNQMGAVREANCNLALRVFVLAAQEIEKWPPLLLLVVGWQTWRQFGLTVATSAGQKFICNAKGAIFVCSPRASKQPSSQAARQPGHPNQKSCQLIATYGLPQRHWQR